MEIEVKVDADIPNIEFIQHIEAQLGSTLVKLGFTRTESNKSEDSISFKYRQFGVCN